MRSRILLHIGSRINISLIADFLRKIMRLPISFFETKKTGDILQRIQDHKRIETLLTSSSISVFLAALLEAIINLSLCSAKIQVQALLCASYGYFKVNGIFFLVVMWQEEAASC